MTNPVLDQERANYIRARIGTSPRKELLPAWSRSEKELPVVDLEVTWIRFSTLNHRTKAEQLSEAQRAGQSDLFSADPLGPEAQQAQYGILKIQEGFADLKDDLKDRRQQEAAVVSADGVLINGNRRAAALRSLFSDDNHMQAQYIRCLVLPDDATPNEIIDLETELQIARDFKEAYSWVNEAMLIEELYQREGRNFERVAIKMHMNQSYVQLQYEKLQQLNQLVNLSDGTYMHIDFKENDSAFEELAKHVRNKSREESAGVKAAYYLGTLTGVNYRDLRNLRRTDAAELVRREMAMDPTLASLLQLAGNQAGASGPTDDLLDDVLGPAETTSVVMDVLNLMSRKRPDQILALPDGSQVLVRDINDTIQARITAAANEAKEEQNDQTALVAPIQRIERAIAEVHRAAQAARRARTFQNWSEEAFVSKIVELRAALSTLER